MEFRKQHARIPEHFQPLLQEIEWLLSRQERVCIALDGRCCAGKTTLSEQLRELYPCSVIHMDHFFLPPDLRTRQRLNTPGGNVHYERFLEQVSPNLNKRGAFVYQAYDCRTGTYRDVQIDDMPLLLVEGSYSHHPAISQVCGLKVFLTLPKETQWARLTAREPIEKLPRFQEEWLPMEELYFSSLHVQEQADLVLDTSAKEK